MRAVVDGKLPPGVTGQGHHPRHHRRDRHRRRHRLCAGICRRGDPRAVDGRPHDRLQHVGGRRRQGRLHRARREGLRLSQGQAEGAQGQGLGRGHALLGDACAPTTARISTARSGSTPPSCRRWSPGAPAPNRWCRSPAACRWRPKSKMRRSASPPNARSATWACKAARRSPTSSSTACSSAPAPMRASRICATSRASPPARR